MRSMAVVENNIKSPTHLLNDKIRLDVLSKIPLLGTIYCIFYIQLFHKRFSCKNIKLSTLSRQEIMGNLSCYFWSEMRNVRAQICKINIFDVKQIDSPGYWTIKTLFV